MQGALSHLRVLDLSRVLAGPWSTQTLADMGADVIKIERPQTGDETRVWGPPYMTDAAGRQTSESAYYLAANRNKRSVAVDISTADGQAVVRQLAAKCDVLVENFKTGALKRYGLDFETLHAEAPRLIYCSITGFGQTGPYARRPGYDFLIQAIGGLMSITGRPDGEPGEGPMKTGVAVTDIMTGLYAAIGILGAVVARDRTGIGQHLDISLLDVQVACLANQAMNFATTGLAPKRMGNSHPNVVPYQDFPTADGYMILAVGNDGQFRRLCAAAGRPELADDERFATNAQRVLHRGTLITLLEQLTRSRRTSEWIALLERENVPCGPINDIAEVFADPQVQAREMSFQLDHPMGRAPMVASPLRMSQTPVSYRLPPPLLGQHTDEVLQSLLDLSSEQLQGLRAKRVL